MTRNKELNQLGSFIVSGEERTIQPERIDLSEIVENENNNLSETKPIKKKKSASKVKKEVEHSTECSTDTLDTFELEEQKEVRRKKTTKKEKSSKKVETTSPKEPSEGKTTENESQKDKDKKKSLLDFTNPPKNAAKKKKAESKNLSEFF